MCGGGYCVIIEPKYNFEVDYAEDTKGSAGRLRADTGDLRLRKRSDEKQRKSRPVPRELVEYDISANRAYVMEEDVIIEGDDPRFLRASDINEELIKTVPTSIC